MSLKPCVFIDLKTGKRYNYDEFRQFLYENPKFWEEKRGAVEREPGLMSKAKSIQLVGNYQAAALSVLLTNKFSEEVLQGLLGGPDAKTKSGRKNIQSEMRSRISMLSKSGVKSLDGLAELVQQKLAEWSGDSEKTINDFDFQEATTEIGDAILNFTHPAQVAKALLELAGQYEEGKYEDEYAKYMMQKEQDQQEAEEEEVGRKALSEEEFKALERQIAEEYIKREQEDAEESEKMFGKLLSDEEYNKMRSAWDNEFADREFTRNLTVEQKQALANLELAMLGLSNAKEAYESEARKQARGSQQELFGSNPLGFVQNESPQALKDKLDRLKTAVDMAQVVADKALAAYQREMGMETRQGELFGEQKPGEIKITQEGNEYTFTLNDVTGVLDFDGGIMSSVEGEDDQKLPDWAKKEAYLNNIENAGRAEGKGKGDGKTVIEAMKRKAKELGADILTLRADMGMGFTGVDSKLYQYYKSLGFVDNNPAKPNGQMYFDLRSKPDEKVERPPVTTKTEKKQRTQTIKDTKLADAAAKNAEKLKGSMDELKNAFNDLLKEMGKQGPATMNGIRTEVLEKAVKVVGIMIKVGIYKFTDIIIQVQQQLGDVSDELFQAIKKAYLAYASDAEEDVFEQMDTTRDIRGTLLTDIFAPADGAVEEDPFENAIRESIKNKTPLNIVAMRKLLPGVSDTDIQERVENIVVKMARDIAQTTMSDAEKLNAIENIYNYQPTLNQRDSTRVQLQQYSTPLPYAFIASSFAAAKNPTLTLEPSAGNGALTIAIDPAKVVANEIDKERLANLQGQGFAEVTNQDALLPFDGTYDAVVMNPPFGSQGMKSFGTETKYQLTGLDPIMTANALESMTNNGVAAIVVGGHTSFAEDGLIESRKDRIFLNYLYHYYNVLDVINVDGSLYRKQGTTYPTRLILINGRKQTPEGIAPIRKNVSDELLAPITNYNDLLKRVEDAKANLLQSQVDAQRQGSEGADGRGSKQEGDTKGVGPITVPGTTVQIPGGTVQGPGGRTTLSGTGRTETQPGGRTKGQQPGGNVGVSTTPGPVGETAPVGVGAELGETGLGETFEGRGAEGTLRGNEPGRNLEESDISLDVEKVEYKPMSKGKSVGTYQPTAMAAETRRTLNKIQEQYGDIDEFVATELGYKTLDDLYKALYAEQIDAVAMTIAQMKEGNGLIVGDMTGVGKGRIAAAVIRYAARIGKTPVFLTEKGDLFSDMYRDLSGIGSAALVPFIFNADAPVTEENDKEQLKVVYRVATPAEIKKAAEMGSIPKGYNYVMATYSQFGKEEMTTKKALLAALADKNILIMDEAHNASGETSNTGSFIRGVVSRSSGTLFLSATFAKRPGNMQVYALKTSMRDTGLTPEMLSQAIEKGGVPLQEIISAQLAQAGQMVRRERDFAGVEMRFTTVSDPELAATQRRKTDEVIVLLRDIIRFQAQYVRPAIENSAREQTEMGHRMGSISGNDQLGVQNTPFASKLFNIMNQLLFSLKAEEAAAEAIKELKENRKAVIGFESTMESFFNDMGYNLGEPIPNLDFSLTLVRGLDKTLEYTITTPSGNTDKQSLDIEELGTEGAAAYYALRAKIQQTVSGISISPIDVITSRIQQAGYKVGEITGRKINMVMLPGGGGMLAQRETPSKRELVTMFNNGSIDAILLNASGSTGISMHASKDFKDQRQRVMIIPQAPLDVNTFIQMLGRIDRTGQVVRGAYNIMTTAIPAESRLQMMLARKIASLFANTTAQQKSSSVNIDVVDFVNKYGNEVVAQYLFDNPDINILLNDPIKIEGIEDFSKIKPAQIAKAAAETVKKVSLLNTKEQEAFYKEVTERYQAIIEYLNSQDENDLLVTSIPLEAETIFSQAYFEGKHTGSPFGEDAVIEVVEANVLRKPMTAEQIKRVMENSTQGESPLKYMERKIREATEYYDNEISSQIEQLYAKRDEEIRIAKQQIDADENYDAQYTNEGEAQVARNRSKEIARDTIYEAYNLREAAIRKRLGDQRTVVRQYLNAMKIGKIVKVPLIISETGDASPLSSTGIVMGIDFGTKTKNPFAPSNITFRIAIRDGRSQTKIPMSKTNTLGIINMRSGSVTQENLDTFFQKWDVEAKKVKNREIRFIMTGNILMGYGIKPGPLVAYTTKEGKIKKGILYRPGEINLQEVSGQISVANAFEKIKPGEEVTTTNGDVSIVRLSNGGIGVSVPKSSKAGKKYFTDNDLLTLADDGQFRTKSGKMIASFSANNAKKALQILGEKHGLFIPGDKISPEVVAEIEERMRQQGQATPTTLAMEREPEMKPDYRPVITNVGEFVDPRTGKKVVQVQFRKLAYDDFQLLNNIAKVGGGRYSSEARGFLFEKGSDATKFQQSAEQAMYEQMASNFKLPQSLFDRLAAKIDELIEREKNLPPGSVAYSSIVPIPPQVARAISIGALRAAKAVIMAAKAANNFTKKTMQDALAAAEQYVRNYMSDPAKFKPAQVEDMVKRVSKLIQPVNPVDVAVEVVTENSELVAEITKATDKAFEKMSALIAKEGMKQARKQAINLMKTILGGAKVPLNPNLIDKILAKFPNSNTDKAMLNFIEYAVGMIQSAEKIKALQSLVDKARTELDKSYAGAEMKARLKPLLRTIEAHKVDPDKMDTLSSMLYAFIQQMAGKNYKAVSIQRLVEMLVDQGAYIDEQTKIRRRAMMQARVDRMINSGALPAGTSVEDYEQMLLEQAEQEEENEAEEPAAPAERSETAEFLIPEITGLMSQARDKAANTGTPFVKRMMRWTGKINLDTLTDNELKRLHNILNDYIELDDLSDLGVYAARGEAQERLKRLNTMVNKFRQYKGDISKMSLNNLLENISGSEEAKNTLRAELYQREEVLFLDTKKKTDDNLQALEAHIIENDMDERSVRATEIFNILAQAGSQNSTWQAWREAMMINWNKYLNKKLEEQRLMSAKWTGIFQNDLIAEEIRIAQQTLNILENDFDPDQHQTLATTIDRAQAELAQMVRNFYAEISEEFRQNTAAFFSKLFDPTENPMYVSLNVIDRLGKGGIDESYSPTLTDTVFEEARIDREESRTAIERTTFTNNAVVYGTDLLANFRKRYYQTLYQAKMTEELFVMDRMIKSEQFRNLFDPQYSDRTTKVILAFMEGVVDGQRYFGYIGVSNQPMLKKLVNGNIGAVLVDLGQYVKQSVGSLQLLARANFKLVGWGLKTAFNPSEDQKRWLNSITTLRDRTYQSESLVGKQYAELNKFAGQTWARKLLVKIGDAIKNTRNFFAKYTIEKADRFVSAAGLFVGYAKSLKEQGLIENPSDINWDEEIKNPNFNALAAAENLSEEINVPSNQTTKAEVLRSEKKSINDFNLKEINWMLAQFDLNAYNNLRNNIRTWTDVSGTSSRADKNEAMAKIFGILLNTGTYTAAKVLMDVLYQQAAIAIALWALGMDFEPEDEEEKKRRTQRSLIGGGMVSLFNLFVGKYGNIAKIIPRLAFASGFALFYKDKEQTEENKGTLKDPNTDLFYDPTGVPVVDLAVRQMVQLNKAIKKEGDAYELARTAGMFASLATGFATIERITAKTTKEMAESPLRKDVKLREKSDLTGESKFNERKVKLFKYLEKGETDYATTIFNKMTGPIVDENYGYRMTEAFNAIMSNLQSDKISAQDKGAEYLGALAYGLGLTGAEISVTLPGKISMPIQQLKNLGMADESNVRRIVQRYEEQYQKNMKMIETFKEVDPNMGQAIYDFFKPGGPGEASMLNGYSIMRRMKKKGAIAYDIPE